MVSTDWSSSFGYLSRMDENIILPKENYFRNTICPACLDLTYASIALNEPGIYSDVSPPFTLTGRTQSILAVLAEWEGRHHNEKVVKNGRSHYASTETTLSKIQEWMTIFNYNNRLCGNVDTAPMNCWVVRHFDRTYIDWTVGCGQYTKWIHIPVSMIIPANKNVNHMD